MAMRQLARLERVSLGAVFALVCLVVGKADPGLHAVVALELGAELGLRSHQYGRMRSRVDMAYGSDLRRLHGELCGGIRVIVQSTVRRRRFGYLRWLRLPLLTIESL